jgi:hypothetical protein
LVPPKADELGPISDGFEGFNWPDFRIAACPGTGCKSFPAESTKQFTGPHMAMAEGLVGGLLVSEFDLKTSPKASFELQDSNGSFDLGQFDVFDIIDLPVSLHNNAGNSFAMVVIRYLTLVLGTSQIGRKGGHARAPRLCQGRLLGARHAHDPIRPEQRQRWLYGHGGSVAGQVQWIVVVHDVHHAGIFPFRWGSTISMSALGNRG